MRAEMAALKASHETEVVEALNTLAEFAPPSVLAAATWTTMRVLERVPQHSVIAVTTNVPGPQYPLYLAGSRMVEYLPFVPIASGCRIGVAILSYDGKLSFGITGDYDTAADIGLICQGIEDETTELLGMATNRTGKPRAAHRRRAS